MVSYWMTGRSADMIGFEGDGITQDNKKGWRKKGKTEIQSTFFYATNEKEQNQTCCSDFVNTQMCVSAKFSWFC